MFDKPGEALPFVVGFITASLDGREESMLACLWSWRELDEHDRAAVLLAMSGLCAGLMADRAEDLDVDVLELVRSMYGWFR